MTKSGETPSASIRWAVSFSSAYGSTILASSPHSSAPFHRRAPMSPASTGYFALIAPTSVPVPSKPPALGIGLVGLILRQASTGRKLRPMLADCAAGQGHSGGSRQETHGPIER